MRHTIYVFFFSLTFLSSGCHPKKELGLNEEASVQNLGDLTENPLLLNTITSSIYPKDSTMTVLYGNDPAYIYAAVKGDGNYPAGAVLYEVTWQLQADEQWFGANIPKVIKTIEQVDFFSAGSPRYKLFQGHMHQIEDSPEEAKRVAFIIGQKIAMSP